jgi:hypothetical protein
LGPGVNDQDKCFLSGLGKPGKGLNDILYSASNKEKDDVSDDVVIIYDSHKYMTNNLLPDIFF